MESIRISLNKCTLLSNFSYNCSKSRYIRLGKYQILFRDEQGQATIAQQSIPSSFFYPSPHFQDSWSTNRFNQAKINPSEKAEVVISSQGVVVSSRRWWFHCRGGDFIAEVVVSSRRWWSRSMLWVVVGGTTCEIWWPGLWF